MLLTEEEAKTKACCKTLEWYQGKILVAPCIASACMAWRADPTPREQTRTYHDAHSVVAVWHGGTRTYPDGWQYSHTDIDQDGRKFDLLHRAPADDVSSYGHCGLAGKP